MLGRALLCVLYLCSQPAQGLTQSSGTISEQIESLIERTPAISRGHLGYLFVDLDTGAIVAEQNSGKLFVPASNTKLFTTALALARLGPNYTFHTKVATEGAWSPGQTTLTGLELIGGGDPNLSGRALPYQVHAVSGDPLAAVKQLANAVFQAGVREINGDLTGVSSRYSNELYPEGWTIDDATYGYGTAVTALALNDNTEQVTLHPGKAGELAEIEISPPVDGLVILNQVVTDATNAAHVHVERPLGSDEIVLSGRLGKNSIPWEQDFAIADPARFAAEALIDALRECGITVRGSAVSSYTVNDASNTGARGTAIATRDSVPLAEIVQIINKVSQNLHAEMLLREVAFVTRGAGTLAAGVDERELFLAAGRDSAAKGRSSLA